MDRDLFNFNFLEDSKNFRYTHDRKESDLFENINTVERMYNADLYFEMFNPIGTVIENATKTLCDLEPEKIKKQYDWKSWICLSQKERINALKKFKLYDARLIYILNRIRHKRNVGSHELKNAKSSDNYMKKSAIYLIKDAHDVLAYWCDVYDNAQENFFDNELQRKARQGILDRINLPAPSFSHRSNYENSKINQPEPSKYTSEPIKPKNNSKDTTPTPNVYRSRIDHVPNYDTDTNDNSSYEMAKSIIIGMVLLMVFLIAGVFSIRKIASSNNNSSASVHRTVRKSNANHSSKSDTDDDMSNDNSTNTSSSEDSSNVDTDSEDSSDTDTDSESPITQYEYNVSSDVDTLYENGRKIDDHDEIVSIPTFSVGYSVADDQPHYYLLVDEKQKKVVSALGSSRADDLTDDLDLFDKVYENQGGQSWKYDKVSNLVTLKLKNVQFNSSYPKYTDIGFSEIGKQKIQTFLDYAVKNIDPAKLDNITKKLKLSGSDFAHTDGTNYTVVYYVQIDLD